MEDSLDFDYIFKYILVGDASVGKSTLLHMFVNSNFKSQSNPTMGVQFATKKISALGKIIKIQVWDTAGQESFRTITRAYYKNAIGVILVYDLTNPSSFLNIKSWLDQIHDNSSQKIQVVIVGNKSDLTSNTKNQYEGKQYSHYITSAKNGMGIQKLFTSLTEKVIRKLDKGVITADGSFGVKKGNSSGKILKLLPISSNSDQQKRSCC